MITAAKLNPKSLPFVMGGTYGLLFLTGLLWWRSCIRQVRRRVVAIGEQSSDPAARDLALVELLRDHGAIGQRGRRNSRGFSLWFRVLPQIASVIEPGRAFLRSPGVSPGRFEPMAYEFEPVRLRDWQRFLDPAAPESPMIGMQMFAGTRMSWKKRTPGDAVREGLLIAMLSIFALAGAVVAVWILIQLVFFRVPSRSLLIFAVMILYPFVIVTLVSMSRREWFLIPAGLVVRNRWALGSRAKIERFTREDSILLYWGRVLYVARRDGKVRHNFALPGQMEAIMRAWLSPQPAPPIEQLREWFGETA